uniref:EGF-like domain-containing protein n=1 Tax=Clytia hemisphaerica TaxID=252671 RepID=A0A7M5URS7_9CNID
SGYTGQLCELKLDLCRHSQYCITKHAISCVDRGDNVTCTCADGWSGSNCGVNIDECEENKCVNNGQCVDEVSGYVCKCKNAFTGLYCEVPPARVVPDIEIDFMADDCHKFMNPQGVRYLEVNIISILQSSCDCPLTSQSIEPDTSKVICKDKMAGTFQTNLIFDNGYQYRKDIICKMQRKIKEEKTPTIYHQTYIVNIKDEEGLCKEDNVVAEASESTSSKTGVIVGVLVTLAIIVIALVCVVYKIKNSRNTKVGITHKFLKKTSFDNAAYIKEDLSKDDSLDETSFMSRDDTLPESVSECPRWADSYDRARKIAGRNRSNVPVGRFFDIHNPGGGTSKI